MLLSYEFNYLSNVRFWKVYLVSFLLYLISIYLVSEHVYHDDLYLNAGGNPNLARKIDNYRYVFSPVVFTLKTGVIAAFMFAITKLMNVDVSFGWVYKLYLSVYPITLLADFLYIFWFLVINPSSTKKYVDTFYPFSASGLINEGSNFAKFMPLLHFLNIPELLFGIIFTLFFSYSLKIRYFNSFLIFLFGYFIPIVSIFLFLYLFKG
jgi:hypothetical protein